MKIYNIIAIIVLVALSYGCASYTPPPKSASWNGDIVKVSYKIAGELENNLNQPLSQNDTIIVATFVDVSNLSKSSAFGRIMSEQVGSRFAQKGYKIVEMKLRQNSIFVDEKNNGEFLLSRNVQDISRTHNAGAVVVGTYAKGHNKVYVSARLVNPVDGVLLSSCDYELDFPEYREMMALMNN